MSLFRSTKWILTPRFLLTLFSHSFCYTHLSLIRKTLSPLKVHHHHISPNAQIVSFLSLLRVLVVDKVSRFIYPHDACLVSVDDTCISVKSKPSSNIVTLRETIRDWVPPPVSETVRLDDTIGVTSRDTFRIFGMGMGSGQWVSELYKNHTWLLINTDRMSR